MSPVAMHDLEVDLDQLVAPAPRLYLLSRPAFEVSQLLEFLGVERTNWRRTTAATQPEELVEVAGRVCYMSFGELQSPKSNREYIANLVQQGHESVLEHVSWTMLLTGVSRAFTHQLVRHRVGFSFSQLSQQYHDEQGVRFVVPDEIRANPAAFEAWKRTMAEIQTSYRSLAAELSERQWEGLSSGKEKRRSTRSAARSVLPNCAETKIVLTANARALRHFLTLRGALMGDLEMRKISSMIYREMEREAPSLFQDFSMVAGEDGFPVVRRTT